MQTTLAITCFCFLSLGAFAQGQSDPRAKLTSEDSKLINSRSADSLIQIGLFYQVFYASCDFRAFHCTDSLAKKYNFKPYWIYRGCVQFAKSVIDSVTSFNNSMNNALAQVNGNDWKRSFVKEDSVCVQCLCSINDSLRHYLQFGIGCSSSLLYQQGQVGLDSTQKCIITHSFLKILNENSNIGIEIIGNSTTSEENSAKTISKKRAENFCDYLLTMGINKARIKISWYGTDRPMGPDDRYSNQNRRVDLRAISYSE